MKIYTKNGDTGKTKNALGNTYKKNSTYIELIGNIDEINSQIGYLRSILSNKEVSNLEVSLKTIQYELFLLSCEISLEFTQIKITNEHILRIEKLIDIMNKNLLELRNFIYLEGTQTSSYCNIIRCTIRKTERTFADLLEDKQFTDSYKYINRLSDYFFVLFRYINWLNNVQETILKI